MSARGGAGSLRKWADAAMYQARAAGRNVDGFIHEICQPPVFTLRKLQRNPSEYANTYLISDEVQLRIGN